jgi:hypothetical protein
MSSPFDMIYGELNDIPIMLRPIQFDDFEYDKEYKKSDGQYIRPTMGITTCPQCGCNIEQEIPSNYNILNPVKVKCVKCSPTAKINAVFPFLDPIGNRTINPLNVNPTAFADLNIILKKKPVVQKACLKQDDLVAKRSLGLGDFLRSRHSWKSKSENHVVEREADIFELMGKALPESGSCQQINESTDGDQTDEGMF